MDIDPPKESNGVAHKTNDNSSLVRPVSPDASGEGLPYAPINWPKRGDKWGWKVGKRVAITGHYLDRYLYLPMRLYRESRVRRQGRGLASKLSIERYIRENFPGTDVDAFFASFVWKIPAKRSGIANGNLGGYQVTTLPPEEDREQSPSDLQSDVRRCKAKNKICSSLVEQAENPPIAAMHCDICCSEPLFCRECCCILCCKSVNPTYPYSYIKCQAGIEGGCVCGHIAHIDCAIRSYMAGTIGGSIGLDAEYYCRRCDAKTDLVSHVGRLVRTCESIDSRDDIEKILNVGICILRDSRKASAKLLLNNIKSVIAKLKSGSDLKDIWKMEETISSISAGSSDDKNDALEVTYDLDPLYVGTDTETVSISFDCQTASRKLDEEIAQVLQALKKSQEFEYKLAEEKLYAQKKYLHNLYEQLEKERSELARHISSTDPDVLLNAVLSRVNQIKKEVTKLKDMKEVAHGFGKTSRGILDEHFGLEVWE